MANTNVAQSPATATTRRAPRLVFRAANARRPFHRGDLALLGGMIVVVGMSEHQHGSLDDELPVHTTRGVVGNARVKNLQLLAGVDTQEFGPGYDDLLKFIAEAGAAH